MLDVGVAPVEEDRIVGAVRSLRARSLRRDPSRWGTSAAGRPGASRSAQCGLACACDVRLLCCHLPSAIGRTTLFDDRVTTLTVATLLPIHDVGTDTIGAGDRPSFSVSSSRIFFETRQPAATKKHAIVRAYSPAFTAMTGKGNRPVTLLDGYAGEGAYDDGSEGSPLLLLNAAKLLASCGQVTLELVEAKHSKVERLRATLAERHDDDRINVVIREGDLRNHLDDILAGAAGDSLLAFLDPFGVGLPFKDVVRILKRPSTRQTEVLLHFSAGAVRRLGGLWRSYTAGNDQPTAEAAAQTLDEFLGGTWWRPLADSNPGWTIERATSEILLEYVQRVQKATGYAWFIDDVRNQPHHAAVLYYLVLFTAHPMGLWKFAESVSYGKDAWLAHIRELKRQDIEKRRLLEHEMGVQTLFGALDGTDGPAPVTLEDVPEPNKKEIDAVLIAEIADNILRLLGRKPQGIKIVEHIKSVYGETLGTARQTHACRAVKALHEQGLIDNDGVSHKGGSQFYDRRTRLVAGYTVAS